MTALCAHRLVEDGRLDLDAPVARYWPEFAQAGKANVPVRWLLGHRAGLAAVRTVLPLESLYDWNAMGPHILLDPRATALIDAVYACR